MSNLATIGGDLKDAFYAAAVTLFANNPDTRDVSVNFGQPGTFEALDIVWFGRVFTQQHDATHSTNRTRNEDITLTVHIGIARPGGQEQEQIASQRAYQLLKILETQVRVTDTTLGGLAWWTFLDSTESEGATQLSEIEQARVIYLTANFVAKARIST